MGGYFDALRASHPVEHGSIVNGMRVVSTYNVGDDCCYMLEGDPREYVFNPLGEDWSRPKWRGGTNAASS